MLNKLITLSKSHSHEFPLILGEQQRAITARSISPVPALTLEHLYSFQGENDVKSFLKKNRFLIPLLQEGHPQIRKHFPDSDVMLKVITDPEIKGQKDLFVFIVVKQSAKEASLALDRLDEEWWLNALDRAKDKLHITLEFR